MTASPAGAEHGVIFVPDLLAGAVALVTGGGTGLGRATALELARSGARVIVCGRRADPLEQTAALAPSITAQPADIRESAEVEALVDGIVRVHGRIDVLVNNAGGQFLAAAESITPKGFGAVMRLNAEGTWNVTRAVAVKSMIPRRGGKVISITLSPHHGLPTMAHSSAARAAVENLMRTLSIEWARYGIRLNAIAAGPFVTEAFASKYPAPIVDGTARSVPLGRAGREIDLARAATFLASPAGDFITGSVFTIDGGRDNWRGPWPPPDLTDEEGTVLEERRDEARDHA